MEKKGKILIVDDNEDVLLFAQYAFETIRGGYQSYQYA